MKYLYSFLFVLLCLSSKAQQVDYVDFKSAKVNLDKFNLDEKWVGGSVDYTFDILKPVDSIYLDSKNIYGYIVFLNDKEIEYYVEDEKLWIINKFQPSKNNKLSIEFNAMSKKAIYFVGWNDEAPNQIWTQGQGKYTSNWLPSIDDVNDKIEFDLSITFDKNYEVISNGMLENKEVLEKSIRWQYDMKQPMSSYLVALAIGKYDKKVETSKSGIPLEMYYYPKDSNKVEPTYRYTKRMFDFLEEEIGFSYPWQNYKQIPVHDFLYAGMENTSATIFSDDFMIDETSFIDKNYVNVNAHELAHQWFGDLVTAKSSEHHWLQEGFATYYALLAEKEVFGDDYYYWRLYEYAQELLEQDKAGRSTSLLNPKSSSLTFYKKGAWVLHMLREKVGDKAFRKAVKKYLKKHQFKNVETNDFIKEVEQASGEDLSEFVDIWLVSDIFPEKETMKILTKNEAIKELEKLKHRDKSKNITKELSKCDLALQPKSNYNLQNELFNQLKGNTSAEAIQLYKRVFNSNNVKSRQAIAKNLVQIPSELKQDYETLLNDKSYITIETALYNLWNNFPEDRAKYLEQTKGIVGFNDKNVRMVWLVLALSTPEFETNNITSYMNELIGYTSPNYGFQVRQNAFSYLNAMGVFNETIIQNLINASKHHNWRFKSFSKKLLESLSKNKEYQSIITNLQSKNN